MKKTTLLLALAFGFATFGFAQNETWTPLFDGKTLNGWLPKGGKANYKAENGEIVGTTVFGTPNSFLITEKLYDDFIFECDIYIENTNSGVQFRGQSTPQYRDGVVHGYQMEADNTPRGWSGGIYDEQRREWLCIPNINPEGKKAWRGNDKWNHYRIEAIGKTVRTFINEVPVSNLLDTILEKGFFGLQVHSVNSKDEEGRKCRWKNLRIQTGKDMRPRPTDDCPVVNLSLNNLTEQEQKQGWKLLFNGKNLDNWRTAFKTTSPTTGWLIKDGVLHIVGSDGSQSLTYGDIVTRDSFKFFELTFEFQLTEGANSGVKYFVNEKYDSKGSAIGLEYQILDDEHHPDAKLGAVGNRTLASLYDLIPSYKQVKRFQRKTTDWQYGRIVVRPDNTVQHWLNGFKVVEYERGSNIYNALVARSKHAIWEGFGMNTYGAILLQDHGNTVFYKNIKVRSLN